tara:strand:- start:4500 stop:4805 length:306 start_codon:yes stop_codon:yes gene_type:complete
MAKIFNGNVSIYKSGTNKLYLAGEPDGVFNQGNVDELVNKMIELGKREKAEVNFFIPQGKLGDKGLNPVILTGRGGKPYVAMLPARKTADGAAKQAPVKLL